MTSYTAIVEKQRRFFKTGKTIPIEFRIEQLEKLKRMIKANVDKISEAIYKDIHRSKAQAYCYEVNSVIVEIDYMIENIAEWSKARPVEKTMLTMLDSPMVKKDPLGVVLIITPWNYPINMAFLPLVPAIAAGNTAIIKPSEVAVHCADVIAEMVAEHFDPAVLTVVKGGVQETTDVLKERFDHILYTGAPPVGKIVMAAAAKHLTPVTLELGGKCPVIVEKDADVEIAAKRIAWGKWLNCGQTCLAPDYIMTTAEVKPQLVDAMKKAVATFYGGNPQTHADYARVINERHFERLSSLLEKTDGKVLMGGQHDKKDLYIEPTILDVQPADAFMKDEIFGPVLPILTVRSLDDAIEQIKDGEKPLAAYIFTKDNNKVNRLITETSSGGVTVNDVILHMTVDTLPFGGVGNSGMGRYRGKYGFDTFSHEKAILKRSFMGEWLMSVRYPPFTSAKFEQLKKLTGGRKGFPKFFRHIGILPILILGVIVGIFIQRFMLHHA